MPLWYGGRSLYGAFIRRVFAMRGVGWHMVPIAANGQPAVAAYTPDRRLHTLQVFTVVFQDPAVFEVFDLPGVLD